MLVIPALDLRAGACVQLVGGSYDEERVRIDDAVLAAQTWEAYGFRNLHLVDLDAATERGSNRDVVRRVLQSTRLDTQVGGGISTAESIRSLLSDGARRVIVGTRAVEDHDWLRRTAQEFPRRLIVAADVRERRVVTRGWRYDSARDLLGVLEDLRFLPLAGVMVTAVHREGRMTGPDIPLIEAVVDATPQPVHVAGGISTLDDLRTLDAVGASAAIVGMALYTGVLDPHAVVQEFGDAPAVVPHPTSHATPE